MIDQYSALLDEGWVPIWTGVEDFSQSHTKQDLITNDTGNVTKHAIIVRMAMNELRMFINVTVDFNSESLMCVATKMTAENPGSITGILPNIRTAKMICRAAGVLGYTALCRPTLGFSNPLSIPSQLRISGLDIEQSIYYVQGGFPLSTDPLISIAYVSWCGTTYFGHVPGKITKKVEDTSRKYVYMKHKDSTELVDWILSIMISDRADFIVIHNGFRYDISRLAVHCSHWYSYLFNDVNLGAKGKGIDMDIMGCTIVDTYFYLSKLHNSEYQSLSLSSIANHYGLKSKLDTPGMSIQEDDDEFDISTMMEYNIHDAWLHIEVAKHSRCIEEMLLLAAVCKSPMSDVSKFISGTLVSSLASSYALSVNTSIDWSPEPRGHFNYVKYKGGYVLDPSVGFHKDVVVVDFASMYPSIMISANISSDSVTIVEDPDEYADLISMLGFHKYERHVPDDIQVAWTSEHVYLMINAVLGVIHRDVDAIAPAVLNTLVSRRKALPDKRSPLGWSYKIAANSYYGALGSSTSGMSCRFAAAAVTALGRYITKQAVKFFEDRRCKVLYGDTDSLFIKLHISRKSNKTAESVMSKFLADFHKCLENTIYSKLKLEHETSFNSVILVARKMYMGVSVINDITKYTIKGMASVRRDRPNVCRKTLTELGELICANGPNKAFPLIISLLKSVTNGVLRKRIPIQECMIETREDATIVWCYVNKRGERVILDKDTDLTKYKGYPDPLWVINYLEKTVAKMLRVCKLPRFRQCVGMEDEYDDLA